MAKWFGVDIGTYSIKMYNHSAKEISVEKTMLAVRGRKEILAFGDEAYEMYEKTPDQIAIHFPIQNGVIAQVGDMESLFHLFYRKASGKQLFRTAKYCLALPFDITEVEKRAFLDVIADAKVHAREIYLADRPIADAVGIGLDIGASGGSLIVNIGASSTEITVISLGGVVTNKVVHSGGAQFNEAICSTLRKQENLSIGDKSAERLKTSIGDVSGKDSKTMEIYGKNTITGLPDRRLVTSSVIYECIRETLLSITDQIRFVIDRVPPEFASDIVNHGIYVTGGSAKLAGIGNFLARELNMRVNIAENPTESVVRGLSRIISEPALRKKYLHVPYEKTY